MNHRPTGHLLQEAFPDPPLHLPGIEEFLAYFLDSVSITLYVYQSPERLGASHHQPGYRNVLRQAHTLSHFVPTTTLLPSHFTKDTSETRRRQEACPGSHSCHGENQIHSVF